MIETYRGTVYPWHCDHMGHMNVQFYSAKFDEATWQLFGLLGLTPEYLKKEHRGMVAVDQQTQYRREALPGYLITIRSGIIEIKPKLLTFFHVMVNSLNDEVLAETRFTGVHIDTIERKSRPFEEGIFASMRRMADEVGGRDEAVECVNALHTKSNNDGDRRIYGTPSLL